MMPSRYSPKRRKVFAAIQPLANTFLVLWISFSPIRTMSIRDQDRIAIQDSNCQDSPTIPITWVMSAYLSSRSLKKREYLSKSSDEAISSPLLWNTNRKHGRGVVSLTPERSWCGHLQHIYPTLICRVTRSLHLECVLEFESVQPQKSGFAGTDGLSHLSQQKRNWIIWNGFPDSSRTISNVTQGLE
ncbi:hypothetical protein M427DRAFT_257890 [Gonapodya prolifera JEL478]|uniref:Uncharacterized protein n=1 Tax=Gonapodya prolifera (strain JEL478) TaxID=1344416 RepID=A0A138ZY24_GONPJ|nr:hypothetical protein M427DRAFT_257890 [Gonapodya prolifera JEL478]|eukprot:KXS09033.1 hypothetical protein M427DRAFT_257890 [Gonapodya prolifera JEL478]